MSALKKNDYFCGGVIYEEDTTKEKRTRKKRFPFPSLFLGLATSLSRGKKGEGKNARETCNTWQAH